jgi:hypothetical protein
MSLARRSILIGGAATLAAASLGGGAWAAPSAAEALSAQCAAAAQDGKRAMLIFASWCGPVEPVELESFEKVLAIAAPSLTKKELSALRYACERICRRPA